MAAARPTTRKNTQTEQNKEDNSLLLYRLERVEEAVKENTLALAGKDNITKADLNEFKAAILERFDEKNKVLQEQLDDKADMKLVDERWGYVKAGFGFMSSVILLIIGYYIANGSK